jgi:Fe-S cluster assembly protein SufD
MSSRAPESTQDAPLPTTRDENWKYANLRLLAGLCSDAPTATSAATLAAARSRLPERIEGYGRIVFVDGLFAASLSDAALPAGVATLPSAESTRPADPVTAGLLPLDRRFGELNVQHATQQLRIDAAPSTVLQVEAIFFAASPGSVATGYPTLAVHVGRGAALSLLERHLSLPGVATATNHRVRADLGPAAQFTHFRLQAHEPQAHFIETVEAAMQADAAWTVHALACGAAAARSTCAIALAGRAAHLTWNAAALGDGEQVNDAHVAAEYLAEQTVVRQTFRGIAAGRARIAFSGRMIVRPTARGADSQQSLRSLLAGPGAEADARPQLEIHTDDVRASHGSTAGKLDADMLFYLLSRGIDRDAANALLKWAFIADLAAKIGVPDIRRQFQQHVAASLRDLGVGAELAMQGPPAGGAA